MPCNRRLFLLGTASAFAGAFLIACGGAEPLEIPADDIPVGGAKIYPDFIIAQPTKGDYRAYVNKCPHQGNRITVVDGDKVRCVEHRSEFSISDGAVVSGPARDALTPEEVAIVGDTLQVGFTHA
ncbi:MAG: Rieske 2Fe-2S domain-containing protein [Corynebacterium sp.]|nr:Rieske 2Fe-2S domain-containing protein [Corynebacterium sp.]